MYLPVFQGRLRSLLLPVCSPMPVKDYRSIPSQQGNTLVLQPALVMTVHLQDHHSTVSAKIQVVVIIYF